MPRCKRPVGSLRLRGSVLGLVLAPLLLASCGAEAPPDENVTRKAAPPAPDWRDDYPFEVRLSPPATSWYAASRAQALDGVAARLMGDTTHESWMFAKLFFERAGPEGTDAVVQVLERSLGHPALKDLARNACEALARSKDPAALPSLMRAATSSEASVSQMAIQAVGTTGSAEKLAELWDMFGSLPQLSRKELVQSSGKAMGAAAMPMFAMVLSDPQLRWLWEAVVEECRRLPPEVVKEPLAPFRTRLPQPTRFKVACILHAAGVDEATMEVLAGLGEADPLVRVAAIQAIHHRGLEAHLDRVLALLDDPDDRVQEAVIDAIKTLPGENIGNHLEVKVFAQSPNVRKAALRAYHERGLTGHLDRLLDNLKERTGSLFRSSAEDLVSAGDQRAVPLLVARLPETEGGDRRLLLQAIAYLRHPSGVEPLVAEFLAPDRSLGGSVRSVRNTAILLTNIEESEPRLRELFARELAEDHGRRAHVLNTLANMAGTSTDEARKRRIHDFLFAVASDRSRLSQERLLALDFLRSSITLDDALALKRELSSENEATRKLINNWLWEFFGPPSRP
jgi:HEAT repeat protein